MMLSAYSIRTQLHLQIFNTLFSSVFCFNGKDKKSRSLDFFSKVLKTLTACIRDTRARVWHMNRSHTQGPRVESAHNKLHFQTLDKTQEQALQYETQATLIRISFPSVWPTVHTNPDKLSTENGTFRNHSSKWIYLKTGRLCVFVWTFSKTLFKVGI